MRMQVFVDPCKKQIYDFPNNKEKMQTFRPNGLTFSENIFYIVLFLNRNLAFLNLH